MEKCDLISKEWTGKRVHFIGIGGVSMSGLARILIARGAVISGSDITANEYTDALEKMSVSIMIGHNARNIAPECDLVITNGAIAGDNPEIIRGAELGISRVTRAELLGFVSREYDNIIAVAGTHGKSTTSGMIAKILQVAGKNPTIHIGANLDAPDPNSNTIIGDNQFFVVEACEYKRSFLTLNPTLAVITNIEADHLDYYKDEAAVRDVYNEFAQNAKAVIYDKKIGPQVKSRNVITPIDYLRVKEWKPGFYEFECEGQYFRLMVPGLYNVENAVLAITAAKHLGVGMDIAAAGLLQFAGVGRRWEVVRKIGQCDIVMDYAHHPTAIAGALTVIKSIYKNPLVIFQPHTYTRTRALFNDFVETLRGEKVVMYKTYAAREEIIKGAEANDIAKAAGLEYIDNEKIAHEQIKNRAQFHDAIIIMGAGDLMPPAY